MTLRWSVRLCCALVDLSIDWIASTGCSGLRRGRKGLQRRRKREASEQWGGIATAPSGDQRKRGFSTARATAERRQEEVWIEIPIPAPSTSQTSHRQRRRQSAAGRHGHGQWLKRVLFTMCSCLLFEEQNCAQKKKVCNHWMFPVQNVRFTTRRRWVRFFFLSLWIALESLVRLLIGTISCKKKNDQRF